MHCPQAAHYLEKFYHPKHVAIIGFSEDRKKSGVRFLGALQQAGYTGEISLLGRRTGEFEGLKLYSEVAALPKTIDMAFCVAGADVSSSLMPQLAAHGIPAGVIYTSGFAEMDGDGAKRQATMVERCRAAGMRLIGPNCPGYFYLPGNVNFTGRNRARGPLGLVSQSGNVAGTLFDQATRYDIGFDAFIGVGNQSDIPLHDHVEFLGQDDNVKAILLYIEGLPDGEGYRFIEICRQASTKKPLVALKGGKLESGMRAARSHTASLSSSAKVISALFEEAGVIEVDHLEDLLPIAETLYRCPPMRGDKLAIVGSGGGHSTMSTDEVERVGLQVPEFSAELQAEFGKRLPAFAPKRNPVDMTGAFEDDPTLFAQLSELTLAHDPDFDGVLNYGLYGFYPLTAKSPHTYTEGSRALGESQRKLKLPFIMYTPYAYKPHESFSALRSEGIPCFYDLSLVARAFAALRERDRILKNVVGASAPKLEMRPGRTVKPETETQAAEILTRHGIAFPRRVQVRSVEEIASAVNGVNFPVVLKAIVPNLLHKSEVGAVQTGIGGLPDLVEAAKRMQSTLSSRLGPERLQGFLIAEDMGRQRELFLGVRRDRLLGTVGVIGFGGVFAEAVNDTSIVILPANEHRVEMALQNLRTKEMWRPFRGLSSLRCSAVVDMLKGLAAALAETDGCQAIECNPVLLAGDRLIAVDAAFE